MSKLKQRPALFTRTATHIGHQRRAPRLLLASIAASGLLLATTATSHYDEDEPRQSYRQSWFAMVGANFGPIQAMMEGDMAWDDKQLKAYADQLAALANMDVSRGFVPGTEKGTTRAKPDIWKNQSDFEQKMDDFQNAANALQAAATEGDKDKIIEDIVATGKSCKSCHDEYKSKDYLY